MSFEPKFVLIVGGSFIFLLVLILYTGSYSEPDKRPKMFKAVSVVKCREVGIFSGLVLCFEPGIGEKLNVGSVQSKRVLFR